MIMLGDVKTSVSGGVDVTLSEASSSSAFVDTDNTKQKCKIISGLPMSFKDK